MAQIPNDPSQSPGPVADPQKLAMLSQLMGQGGQSQTGAAPAMGQPTPTPSPMGPTNPFDMASNIRSVMGIPEVQGMLSNLGNIQSQLAAEQMRGRALATPMGQTVPGTETQGTMPKMQFSPDMHGSLLHKIGQALLAVGAATGPGEAIQGQVYGPARRSWDAQRAANVQAISDLKDQLGVPTEELKAVSGLGQGAGMLAYRGGVLSDKEQRTQIARRNSDTAAQRVANEQANALVRQSQGWNRLSIDQQRANADSAFKAAVVPIMQARIDAGMDENEARVQAQEDIRAAAANNSYIQTHPVLSAIFGVPSGLAQAPAAQVTTPLNKNAPVTPKKKGGGKKGDPLGIL